MKMQWWQIGFLIGAGWIVYRVFFWKSKDYGDIEVSPAVVAGATQGSATGGGDVENANSSAPIGQITGISNPTPDLGYNFSTKKNNTFSPPGNSQSPTFLAYGSDADIAISPIVQTYLENLHSGWMN